MQVSGGGGGTLGSAKVPSGVVLAAAPTNPAPALIDISDNTDHQQQPKSKKTKNNEKALLLSDDEFQ